MKILILICAFVSFSSFAACVDLSGTYAVCRSMHNDLIEGTDMVVQMIPVPHNTLYKMSFLPDGSREREEVLIPTNRATVKDSWVGPTGTKYERSLYAACLGNLLQVHTEITRDGEAYVKETSQYYKQGEDLVRISRGKLVEYKYTDILTCR